MNESTLASRMSVHSRCSIKNLQIINTDLSVKGRTVKLYEENIGEHLHDLGFLKQDMKYPP